MPKVSPNIIEDLTKDWGNDTANGLPYSGEEVQRFIKSYLGKVPMASWFNSNTSTMYWFDSREKMESFRDDPSQQTLALFSTKLEFNSDLFRVFLTNNNSSNIINIATNQDTVELSLDFEVQTKSVTDTIWQATTSGVNVSAAIDVGATGEFTTIHTAQHYNPGETYTLNVRPYLETGVSRVRITFVDEDDSSVMASFTYTINMSAMFIESVNNGWFRPIVEGGDPADYKLGGFRIIGNLYKTLHIDIYSGTTLVKEITYAIGPDTYDQIYFNYTSNIGLDLSSLQTGVYLVSAYLTAGSGLNQITTAPVNYNIMYVAAADVTSAQLVCVNNVSNYVYNYADSTMFHYAIYNKGQSTGSPTAVLKELTQGIPTIIDGPRLDNVETGKDNTYVISLMWLTQETVELKVQADITYGNTQIVTSAVDNRYTYPPTGSYDFYLNSASGNNSDTNREKLLNLANNTYVTPTWTRMSWVDNIDGWTYDGLNRKGLYIPAGSRMSLPDSEYKFLMTPSTGLTFEICYRVSNSSDYDETVISIMDNINENGGFRGIRIKPTNITVHSSSGINSSGDALLGVNLTEGEVIHFVLTLYPNYRGFTGKNLVTGYINGCKNFQFFYEQDNWDAVAPLVIGGDKSDVMVYFIRSYKSAALSGPNVTANYLNSIVSTQEEQTVVERQNTATFLREVLNDNESTVDYKAVKKSNKNYFVVEMLNGATVPSMANGWTKEVNGFSNLEMHYGEHPEWDWKIQNTYIEGQGTTSMRYFRWNIKWRIDKNPGKVAEARYLAGTSLINGEKTYTWQDPATVSSIQFDGPTLHPEVSRITAKINFASSMQSHKMGATWAYNELHDAVGLSNEAQENSSPKPVVSVYQYPAYGFAKEGNTYTFIGLFTIGPDKGDKATFGHNLNSVKSSLISMEGSDHYHSIVMFSHPWGEHTTYSLSDEYLNLTEYSGAKRGGWEVGDCYGIKTDSVGAEAAINAKLVEEFKPAYDIVFNNSTMIFGIADTEYEGGGNPETVLSYIQSHKEAFRDTIREGNRLANSYYQFWIDGEYKLYYYDELTKQYEVSENLGSVFGTPQGSTIAEKNEWFKSQRRARFMANAEKYWDIQDSIYHYTFMILIGAVDNFGKNTYPYKMASLGTGGTIGGTWKWRQDDLDSILGINNAGTDTIKPWSEYDDSSAPGTPVYGGSPSVFWTLIHECYMNDYTSIEDNNTRRGIRAMGKAILGAMASLSNASSTLNGIISYFKSRFWDKAQEYFPQSAYNIDATFKYEDAWIAGGEAIRQAAPLPQSLGNHYSAEYLWTYNRAVYLMSLFRAGPFATETDSTLGQVVFRRSSVDEGSPAEVEYPITLTPFTPIYPVLMKGQTPDSGTRTFPGSSYAYTDVPRDGQTTIYLNGADLYTSFGDWRTLNIDTTLTSSLSIGGKKLVTFKMGDVDSSAVSTNIPNISFADVPCLEKVDARNAESLRGTIDVSGVRRLKELYLEGTNVTNVTLADGQKITTLHYPDTIQAISLKNLKYLTAAGLVLPSNLSEIDTLYIYGCPNQNAFDLLTSTYNTEGNKLAAISIQQEGVQEETTPFIKMLVGIANNKNKDGETKTYTSATSATSVPKIEGTVRLTSGWYGDEFAQLTLSDEEEYETTLRKVRINNFGALDLIYNPTLEYQRFIDPTVESIAISHWGDTAGLGVLKTRVSTVGGVSTYFAGSAITAFNELQNFTGITALASGAFQNCTSLTSIALPSNLTSVGDNAVRGCTSLTTATFPTGGVSLGQWAFTGCRSLSSVPNLKVSSFSGYGVFNGCTSLTSLDLSTSTFTNIVGQTQNSGSGVFGGCTGLTTVVLPTTCTTIGEGTFQDCTSLTSVTGASNITNVKNSGFRNTRLTTYDGFNALTWVGAYAFIGTKFTSIVCPNLRTTSGTQNTNNSGSFASITTLTYAEFGPNCSTIGQRTFQNCSSLTTFVCRAVTPPTLESSNAFSSTHSSLKIYVPYGCSTAYQEASVWSSLASRINELDEDGNIPA